jgi:hypothetical protein
MCVSLCVSHSTCRDWHAQHSCDRCQVCVYVCMYVYMYVYMCVYMRPCLLVLVCVSLLV